MDIGQVLRETITGDPARTAADVARYFHPSYVQTTDGQVSSYAEFVRHIEHVRSVTAAAELTVAEVVADGAGIADRHTVRITRHNGRTAAFEVLLIGRLAEDGRLIRVTETTRQLQGDPADAGLGRAAS